jgi:nitrate reductase NapE component
MDEFDPTDTHPDTRRREMIGFLLLALVAGLMIVVAVVLGGGVGD